MTQEKRKTELFHSKILGHSINVGKATLENLMGCLYFNTFMCRVVDWEIRPRI